MAIAKVEPLTTARALRGPFDYLLPERLAGVGIGSVLVVPFGHRRLVGVVVGLAESSDLPPERLAEPIEALEAGTPAELVRLGLWVAREYCSTPARGLELVLPPGVGRSGGSTSSSCRPRSPLPAARRFKARGALARASVRPSRRWRATTGRRAPSSRRASSARPGPIGRR